MDNWFLGIHSTTTLLDQWLPEVLNWMFHSTSDINISIPTLFSATRLLSWLQWLNSGSDIQLLYSFSILQLFPTTCDLQQKGFFIQAAIKALL